MHGNDNYDPLEAAASDSADTTRCVSEVANRRSRRRFAVCRSQSPAGYLWIAERYRDILEDAGLAGFDEVMNTKAGRCLRVLPDRENWYLPSSHCGRHRAAVPKHRTARGDVPATMGMYLKKHRARTWATRIAAAFGAAYLRPARAASRPKTPWPCSRWASTSCR